MVVVVVGGCGDGVVEWWRDGGADCVDVIAWR